MLTPEDQKRIQEEEQYRASLRSVQRSQAFGRLLAIPVILGAIWLVAAFLSGLVPSLSGLGPSLSGLVPITHSIARGPVAVSPLSYMSYRFAVPDAGGHVTGSFSAFGGMGNDI